MTESCVACEGRLTDLESINGYVEGESYKIVSCETCGTREALPHVAGTTVYDWIYAHRSVAPGYARYAQFADEVLATPDPLTYLSHEEEMYYGVAKSVRQYVPKGGKILDVGCGLGYLTYSLNKDGYHATGIDISKEAVDNARKTYGDFFLCGDFFMIEGAYDAICMLELIEHVEDPSAFIAKAKTLLKEGGVLIMTTPNRSWFPEHDLWNTDLPPVHLTWFTEEGIRKLLVGNGLVPKFFDFKWYNLLRGTLLAPRPAQGVRAPAFSSTGKLLAVPYEKSKLRRRTEKYGVYKLFKSSRRLLQKPKEFLTAIFNPSRISLHRSGTVCVLATFH